MRETELSFMQATIAQLEHREIKRASKLDDLDDVKTRIIIYLYIHKYIYPPSILSLVT